VRSLEELPTIVLSQGRMMKPRGEGKSTTVFSKE